MISNGASTVPPVDDDPKPGGSKKVIGAAVVIAAIVVLGLVLTLTNLLGGKNESTPTAAAPSTSTTASSSPSTTAVEASVCGLSDVQMSGTVSAAPTAIWALVGTTAAPSIKDQGPGKVGSDGFRSCYARTPTGALLAAANLVAMGSRPDLGRKVTGDLTVPGPGRDKALAQPDQPGTSSVRIQTAGFRILRYDGTSADVDLAIRTSNGALGGQVFNLRWTGGDWKVVLADSSDLPVPIVQLPSLNGYILWSGA